jgi:hypothetical protein
VSAPKFSKAAARSALLLARHYFAEELRAARRFNPGSDERLLRASAAAAALPRMVGALERVAGTTGTLEVLPAGARRGS